MNIRKYATIAVTSARSNLAYRSDLLARIFFLSVLLYIFLRLWQTTYGQMGQSRLGDLTLAEMLWYLTLTEAIVLSGPRIAQSVDEEVRTGTFTIQLVRPVSYPLYWLCSCLGERIVRFIINAFAGGLIALFLVGPIAWKPAGFAMLALSLPLAFVLDFLAHFAIGLAAFWLEDTTGLFLLYSRVSMLLGGVLIPVQLYPELIKPLVELTPFRLIVYGPAHIFVHPDISALAHLLLAQSLSVLLLGGLVALIYRKALSRVFAHGG